MHPIFEKMKELEAYLEPLLAQSETWMLLSTTTSPVDVTEEVVARSLRSMARIKLNRCVQKDRDQDQGTESAKRTLKTNIGIRKFSPSARIKLHRYCAFFDIPVFSRKHCDLQSLNNASPDNIDEPRQWPTCSCSTFAASFNLPTPTGSTTAAHTSGGLSPSSSTDGMTAAALATPSPSSASVAGTTTSNSSTSTSTSNHNNNNTAIPNGNNSNSNNNNNNNKFPFSSHQSAKICLKSALNIARAFDDLPFPNPTGCLTGGDGPPVFLSHTSATMCPRTMPSFACCAMQCAYALLMVHQKTKTMYAYSSRADVGMQQVPMSVSQGQGQGQPGGPTPVAVTSLLMRLQQGLTSIYATLANYATAFEALGGMRGMSFSCVFFLLLSPLPHSVEFDRFQVDTSINK